MGMADLEFPFPVQVELILPILLLKLFICYLGIWAANCLRKGFPLKFQ
jgi:hypothetical protein